MRILHISAVKNWGGGEKHIIDLCKQLQKMNPGMQNLVLCKENDHFHQILEDRSIDNVPAPLSFKLDPRYIFKLISTCKKREIDLLHIHDSTALALAVIADHLWALPPFVFSKKTSFPIRKRRGTLYKYNYPKLQSILCVSQETKRVAASSIAGKQRLEVVYHGTSTDDKSCSTSFFLREKFGMDPNGFIVGNIANHIEAKNLETFIRAASKLAEREKRYKHYFIQIGSFSKLTPPLVKLVKALKLEKRFFFLDYIPEAANYIPQFDCTLISSEIEGVPQVLYESFYHEVPVVSTRAGGIPEVIEHERTGLLADVYDAHSLAVEVEKLQQHPQLREKIVRTARAELKTSRVMAEKTLAVYSEILLRKD